MDTALKQRIIGIVVLLSLGLILVPLLFSNDSPVDKTMSTKMKIPTPPPLPKVSQKLRLPTQPAAKEIKDTVAIPEVWVVQLGVFKDQQNAQALIKKLRAKSFPAFTKLSREGKERVTRVFIGPEIDENKAYQVVVQLQKIFNMKGMVVRHKL